MLLFYSLYFITVFVFISVQNMLAAATMPKRATSPIKKRDGSSRNAPPSRKTSSGQNNSFSKMMRSSGDLSEAVKLSKSQQVIMSMTRQMGKPAKSGKKQRRSTSSKSDLRDSWERLSTPVSHSDDQVARKLKGKNKFGRADDIKNCTFQPKCKGWKGEESKEEEDEDGADSKKVLRMFVKRQDNWTSVTRKSKQVRSGAKRSER